MPLSPVTNDKPLPARLPIPKLTQLTAPNKLVFLAVHTKKIAISPTQYKRVCVSGYAIYWRRERRKVKEKVERFEFSVACDFFEWVTKRVNKRETLYLYSYDTTTDFLSMDGFRQLPLQDFVFDNIYHKLTTTILKFKNGTRRITILDIQNYYPVKLDKLASSFKVELDANIEEGVTQEQALKWCITKAELLKKIIEGLIKETVKERRGSLKMTSSSTSHSIYRASYMKHKIVTNHQPEVVNFERSAYVGGFTGLNQLVETGSPDLYKVDVNSMYPSVMMAENYPTQLIEFSSGVTVKHLERFLHGYLVIANVNLYARSPHYPLKMDEQNFYPLGEYTTTLASASLKRALESDEIQSVNHLAVYVGNPIFKEFVEDVYNRRMQARAEDNTAHELMQKAINNTLYGKFGQLQTETVRVGDAPIDEFCVMDAFSPADNTSWIEMHAGGSILFIHKRNESRYTSFAIASHITDYARHKLFDMVTQAGRENVFYMDTDSLIVNKEGLHNLYPSIHQTQMGLLKLEDTSPFYIGFAKKDYIFGDKRKLKGFSQDGKRQDANVFTAYQKASIQGAMHKRVSGGAFWKEVNKYYNPFLNAENIEEDGTVTPLHLPQESNYLGVRKYTLRKIKELARYKLPVGEWGEVGQWLSL